MSPSECICTTQPAWRADLQLGACPTADNGLAIVIKSEKPYTGRLCFDIPRHRLYMGFTKDWPRMNTLPEWFTVEPENTYAVKNLTTNSVKTFTGEKLHAGIQISLKNKQKQHFLVQ